MDEKKNVSLTVVILNCLCAVLWSVSCVIDYINGELGVLRILCAACWCVCAVVWISRYHRSKKQESNE